MGDSEADYLRETVGEALAKGCLKTALAAPSDPVEYLGTWLLKFVENAKIKDKFGKDKAKAAERRKGEAQERAKVEEDARKEKEKKDKAVEEVQKVVGDPYKIWSTVAASVSSLTPGCCYIANLAKPEPTEGEITEEDLEVEEVEPEEPEEEEEEAKEEVPAEGEEEAKEEGEEEAKEEPEGVTFDYSGAFLDFVVTSKDMEYILEKGLNFHRPIVDEESEEEPVPSALAFDILDKQKDSVDIPNVLYEPRVKFLNEFPRVGAFYALPIKSKNGEVKAIFCSDTLAPTGNGKPFNEESKGLIKSLIDAAGQAMDSTDEYFANCDAKAVAKAIKEEIFAALEDKPAEGEEEAAAAEAPAEGEEAPAEPSVAVKTAALHAKRTGKIADIVLGKMDKATEDIKRYSNAPTQTYGVLKALMILSGYDAGHYSTWKAVRKSFTNELFEKIKGLDLGSVTLEAYTHARACTKLSSREDLIAETPVSGLGLAAKLLFEELKLAIKASVVEKVYDLATCPHEDAINFEEFVAGIPGDKDDGGALTTMKLGSMQFKDLKETCDKLAEAVAAVEKAAAEQAKAEAEAAAAVAAAEAKAAEEAAAAEAEGEGAEEAPAAEEEAPAAE
ncbi:hypothetical protein HOP50_11g63590 [Chloropicon primus]|uniref:Uncharacterized protein n=2 Tax=Chloropicon primus TaxID=1764295 RepID=A0A5B8MT68_9CHLO|nr:hypothetical protein A3770_11p63370 [Chloropicon primus]UPR03032.1 hypothetical protein HOP50_11g63590 [Chloropicon primus]|eukprot:QDZ23819.1 hypothetical protein A3770_11p63370 [Chloropicon primus]